MKKILSAVIVSGFIALQFVLIFCHQINDLADNVQIAMITSWVTLLGGLGSLQAFSIYWDKKSEAESLRKQLQQSANAALTTKAKEESDAYQNSMEQNRKRRILEERIKFIEGIVANDKLEESTHKVAVECLEKLLHEFSPNGQNSKNAL